MEIVRTNFISGLAGDRHISCKLFVLSIKATLCLRGLQRPRIYRISRHMS